MIVTQKSLIARLLDFGWYEEHGGRIIRFFETDIMDDVVT